MLPLRQLPQLSNLQEVSSWHLPRYVLLLSQQPRRYFVEYRTSIITEKLKGTAIEAFWSGTSFLLTSAVFQPVIAA